MSQKRRAAGWSERVASLSPSPRAWPIIEVAELAHVGTLDPLLKGCTHNATSFEGAGLSVSNCPEAWRQIARLGDQPTWRLRKDGGKLLDVLKLDADQRALALAWAEKAGLLSPARIAEISYTDAEDGSTRTIQFDADAPDAAETIEAVMEMYQDDAPTLKTIRGHKATKALIDRLGYQVPLGLAESLALTVFAEDVLAPELGIDGLWWEETLAPELLSAPRGVIFRGALASWSISSAPSVRTRRAPRPS